MYVSNLTSVHQPSKKTQDSTKGHWPCPLHTDVLRHAQQSAGGGHTGGTLMNAVVIIQNSRHKLYLWSAARPKGVSQFGADGQSQPPEHEVEFFAEAPVYPEVEDAVEETVGGWQPHHHKLDPFWYAAAWDCCGAENTGIKVGQEYNR